MKEKILFTSESVSEGHPDKVADQISDAILDEILKSDPLARVACETSVTTGTVIVFGEISTTAYIDIPKVVRRTIREIGYDDNNLGFNADSCSVMVIIDEQSPDIAMGVNESIEVRGSGGDNEDVGAGDQGLMFGYATNETNEYMPLPIILSHKLTRKLSELRKENTLPYLRPDNKAQVTVEYDGDGKPIRVDTIVISTQHAEDTELSTIERDMKTFVIDDVIPSELIDDNTKFLINPTGKFVIGGPQGDSGLTGRKIIVDTYGGMARHGGGAFSGKDSTKVDRSASYMARYIAKNIVAAGLADKCEVQLAYAIGVANPVSISINTFETGKVENNKLISAIRDNFELTPSGIIKSLDLRRPIFKDTSAYGHFGRDEDNFTWEKTDKVEDLKSYFE